MYVNGWTDKDVYTHTHNEILFCHEKAGNPVVCKNLDELWGIMPKEVSQTEKDKCWSHLYVESKIAKPT